jgi:hypothetical protein
VPKFIVQVRKSKHKYQTKSVPQIIVGRGAIGELPLLVGQSLLKEPPLRLVLNELLHEMIVSFVTIRKM